MKIKRAPLLGAIGSILIIILLLTTIFSKQECAKLKKTNDALSITVSEQKNTITKLESEKNDLTNQVSSLTQKNKELEQEINKQKVNKQKVNKQKQASTQTNTASKPQTSSVSGTGLGQFKITAYCSCSKCCGKWSGGPTASGVMPKAGRTIAVDPKVIPLGTKVIIDGHTYIAEDTGSAIKGKKIDMYFSSHSAALAWGVKYKNVSIVK